MNAPIINGHADASPWSYAETRLRTCGRVISLAPDKLAALTELANGLAGDVREGFLNGQDVVDRLHEVSDAYGLIAAHGEDAIQRVISEGLDGRDDKPLGKKRPAQRGPVGGALVVSRASEIEPEPVEWLWPGRIAIGKQTLMAGEAGLGKSQVSIAIGAAVTTGGPWPCGEGRAPLGNVVILSAEDGAADTIVPRLMAAGADRERVHIVRAVVAEDRKGRRAFNLALDLDALEKKITEIGNVRLVIVDPISSYLGAKVDSHVNAAVRGVLEPVGEMAERRRVAILSITHPPKGTGTTAINRFIGSIAFVAAARAAFMVTKDAEDEDRRLFLPVKNNLAPLGKGLAFRLEQRIVGNPGKGIVASSVAWESEPVTITADQALRAADDAGKGPSAQDEAEEFLRDQLGGGPAPAKDVQEHAKVELISVATLRRAKSKLGILVTRKGFGPGSGIMWGLPDHRCSSNSIGAHYPDVSTYDENEHLCTDDGFHGPPPPDSYTHNLVASIALPSDDDGLGIPDFLRRT